MVLEVVDREHPTGLLDKERVLVDASILLLVRLADFEDVLQSVESPVCQQERGSAPRLPRDD